MAPQQPYTLRLRAQLVSSFAERVRSQPLHEAEPKEQIHMSTKPNLALMFF